MKIWGNQHSTSRMEEEFNQYFFHPKSIKHAKLETTKFTSRSKDEK